MQQIPHAAYGVLGGLVAGYLVQLLFSNRAGSEAEVRTSLADVPHALGWFVALEYFQVIDNRTFIVFYTKNALCGAYVRGTVSAPVHLTDRWKDPLFYPRASLVAKLRAFDIESPAFLTQNKANFQIRREDVESVEHSDAKKWGMGQLPYSGRLFVQIRGGRRREFVLLGVQDGPALAALLRERGFGAPAWK
jgi:hypothetical protein